MEKLILASQSPRRRQLLAQLIRRPFSVITLPVCETAAEGLSPQETVLTVCRQKADAAAALIHDRRTIWIAADTLVFLNGRRLGKPASEADAKAMLRSLSGQTHLVCTGITVAQGMRRQKGVETTSVTFRPLSEREIDAYIATGEPMDKAGAYGIQGKAALFIAGIEGDYYNVMGLPLCRLGQMLESFGVDLWSREEEP